MPKLTIFVKSQDLITISSFHFAHGGHFENMQIRIIHVFGYIRFIFNEENHLHMNFWTLAPVLQGVCKPQLQMRQFIVECMTILCMIYILVISCFINQYNVYPLNQKEDNGQYNFVMPFYYKLARILTQHRHF